MIDIKNIRGDSVIDQVQSYSKYLWIVVACIPFLFQLPSTDVPVWALGLVLGGGIANKYPLRWISLAWLISVFFPQQPFLLLACCGVLLRNWRDCIYAALLGSVLTLIPIPGEFKNIGTVFIIVGLISIIYERVK
ncbi:MAG: hypothetical protein OCD76_14935 [Reichenbachiella sp.]